MQTFKITPASNVTVSPTQPTETTPKPEPTSDATPVVGATITIAGIGNIFDVEVIEASAGSVIVVFDNRDAGVVHNIHFFSGDDADDESVAETEIEVGPIKQTVTFDAQPGAYFYQCDAHPNTMSGTLTVQ